MNMISLCVCKSVVEMDWLGRGDILLNEMETSEIEYLEGLF